MKKLTIRGSKIVTTDNQPVYLRGTNVGGWLNMENFINGYTGSEASLRALMRQGLGENTAAFFFERLLEHFFNESDVRFLNEHGVNVIRLPLNYRHFERDMTPFEYMESGFQWLDRVLGWCEKHGVYVILDLHAVQGWQNSDWHCDNSTRHSLFWGQRQFQDRFYALWQEIARRCQGRGVVAAYNIMNEPLSNAPFGRFLPDDAYCADWPNMNRIYRNTIDSIRRCDAETLIMIEGDYFSTLFDGMERPSDANVIYSSHNYLGIATSAIAEYPLSMDGTYWDAAKIRQQFTETEGYRTAQAHGIPLVVGEFGFNARHAQTEPQPQIRAFADQLSAYNQCGAHWAFWTYKDVGAMGWIQTHPESPYMRTLAPLFAAKAVLQPDFGWLAGYPAAVEKPVAALSNLISSFIPDLNPTTIKRYFAQAALSTYTADQLQVLYVRQFVGKSETEIDRILESFRLENCLQNQELNAAIKASASFEARDPEIGGAGRGTSTAH